MNVEQHSEEAIFKAAIKMQSPAERTAYVKRACGSDANLFVRLETLLQAHEDAGDFLETGPFGPGTILDIPPVEEGPGMVIGRYKLLERIGEGGMAVVYMAEQEQPIRRKVALKIIKLGMDTKQVIARFEAERQALAMMDHPNIAKVFDAGATETGRPYFVMELVQGVSITEYCDRNSLSTRERLGLFIQVCNAVQHAHQKGIIHRDIKPSNVMVTHHDGKPIPKVIDFGIAKATNQRLTEKTLFTRYAHIIGTPAYMSPEQAELSDTDIDTRSDIYSLGVLLYELLTGTTPFSEKELRKAGYVEMQRIIREQVPVRPSTKLNTLGETLTDIARQHSCSPDLLRRTLRGDLDWIVMRSLEKDRTRRYDSTSAFLDDIKRHLNHEPVSAGPPSGWYRTRKFLRRHRILVLGVTVVVVTIVTGLGTSTSMYVRAERARAETQTVTDFLTNDLLASVYPEKAKSQQVTVRYILQIASENLEGKFQNSPLAEAAIRETLGLTYQKMGDYPAAEPHLQHALDIRRDQLGEEDPSTLVSLSRLGRVCTLQGQYAKAEAILENVLATRIRVLGEEHPDTLETMFSLGELHVYRVRFEDAYPLLTKVLEIGNRVLGEEHRIVLDAMLGLAYVRIFSFQHDRAYPLASKGFEISRRVLGEEHETTLGFMSALVCICRKQERYDEGKDLSARALEIGHRVFGQEHPVTLEAMSQLGDLYVAEGRYEEAAPLLAKAVDLGRRALGREHAWTQWYAMRLLRLYEARGQYEELEALAIDVLETSRETLRPFPLSRYFQDKLRLRIDARRLLARGHYDTGKYADALRELLRQAELREFLPAKDAELGPPDIGLLVMSLRHLGRDEEAEEELDQLRRMFAQGDHTREVPCLCEAEQVFAGKDTPIGQAWGFIESGELQEASRIIEGLRASVGDREPDGSIRSLRNALVIAYYARGRRAEGRGEYGQAIADYELSLGTNPVFARAHEGLGHLLATCQSDGVRDGVRGIEHATQACELTKWENPSFISTLAAAHAEVGDFRLAVECQKQAIDLLKEDKREQLLPNYETRLRLYEAGKPYHRSMVAWWTFEQSDGKIVLDASGNGLNGRLVGDAHTVGDLERPGKVLCLDGEGDWVDCGSDVRLSIISEITVTCWMKTQKFDRQYQTVISKGKNAWGLARDKTTATLNFGCSGLAVPNETYGAARGQVDVNDGRWHHVAGVYDGTRISLYVDGQLDGSSEASGNINTDLCKVLIGETDEAWSDQGRDRAFNGLLDDARIYDYALSATAIETLYRGGEP